MTSDSTRLNTEAPHKTPASTRRVALLLCLDLSEFAFIDVSSPRDRDLALSRLDLSAQPIIAAHGKHIITLCLNNEKPDFYIFHSRLAFFLDIFLNYAVLYSRLLFEKMQVDLLVTLDG